jgi:hypothetical protein
VISKSQVIIHVTLEAVVTCLVKFWTCLENVKTSLDRRFQILFLVFFNCDTQ